MEFPSPTVCERKTKPDRYRIGYIQCANTKGVSNLWGLVDLRSLESSGILNAKTEKIQLYSAQRKKQDGVGTKERELFTGKK